MYIIFIASSLSISQSILFGDILCPMLTTILHWGIPHSLSSSILFCRLSRCSFYLLTFVSCHTGAYPHSWVHWRFADFSHYSICFLIFASHHTGAYPLSRFSTGAYLPFFRFTGSHVDFMVVRPIFWSLWVIAEGIPLPSSCLGHPPIVIWFRASPFFQLYHHHGFSSLGFQIYHHHRSDIYGLWSVFHHHRFSSMSIYFSCFTTIDQTSMGFVSVISPP